MIILNSSNANPLDGRIVMPRVASRNLLTAAIVRHISDISETWIEKNLSKKPVAGPYL
jgi:hypothetical protein